MNTPPLAPTPKTGFSLKQLLAVAAGVMLLTAAVAALAVKIWFFPQPFKPVALDQQEERRLEEKLERLEAFSVPSAPQGDFEEDGRLRPERYSEDGASREVSFSEREINSLLAKNTDLADKLAVDFAENLISLRLLLPLDPDFPVMGGKTLRLRAGAELSYRDGRPAVILKGISLMGVPLPNAWLGGLKNIDLMQEFGGTPGFWQSLGAGLESVSVQDGKISLRLRE